MHIESSRPTSANTYVDDDHIELSDHRQVEEWARRLGIGSDRLRELVARVGPRVSDIAAELNRPDSLD